MPVGNEIIDSAITGVINIFGTIEMAVFFFIACFIAGAVIMKYDRMGIIFTGIVLSGMLASTGTVLSIMFPVSIVIGVAFAVHGILSMGGDR